MITFDTRPDQYKHWQLTFDGPIATLSMDVREDAGLSPDYKLKLNSYDLGVDIELADAIQRIRFEHPDVRTVIVTSLKERIFCAGANIMACIAPSYHPFLSSEARKSIRLPRRRGSADARAALPSRPRARARAS